MWETVRVYGLFVRIKLCCTDEDSIEQNSVDFVEFEFVSKYACDVGVDFSAFKTVEFII